jgi:patatin-like phospholipase/acyl hydrolase
MDFELNQSVQMKDLELDKLDTWRKLGDKDISEILMKIKKTPNVLAEYQENELIKILKNFVSEEELSATKIEIMKILKKVKNEKKERDFKFKLQMEEKERYFKLQMEDIERKSNL